MTNWGMAAFQCQTGLSVCLSVWQSGTSEAVSVGEFDDGTICGRGDEALIEIGGADAA